MPFTLAHPAAVLPLLRRGSRLPPEALVAGAMAPDVPFFTGALAPPTYAAGRFSHTLGGVVTLDLVLACGLVLLWRWVRLPLLGLLPEPAAGRLAELTRARRRPHPLWAALAAVIGAVTHVVWDDFTHPGRLGSRIFPVLDHPLLGVRLAWWLQYGTSLAALVLMAWLLVRALRQAPTAVVPAAPADPAAPAHPVVPADAVVHAGPAGAPAESAAGARTSRRVARPAAARVAGLALLLLAALGGAAAGWHRYRTAGGVGSTPLDPVSVVSFYTGAAVVCWSVTYAAVVRAAARTAPDGPQARISGRDRREPGSPRDRAA